MSCLRIDSLLAPGVDASALTIDNGTCVALHGPSGSGKTRLLRAIADLDEARGDVWLDDRPRSAFTAPKWRARVMYLSAESHWWLPTVRPHAVDWHPDHLEALGFSDDVLDWQIRRLSSGERQRLALARALAHRPAALLLDEPSANLDIANTERVERLITDWRQSGDGCVLWVSHDPAQRARVAGAVYSVNNGILQGPDD